MAIIGLIFAACSSDNHAEFEPTPNEDNSAIVAISLQSASTRANQPDEEGVGNENTISSLDFYVFKTNGEYVQTNSFAKQSSYKFIVKATEETDLNQMHFLVGVNQSTITGIPAGAEAMEYVKRQLSDKIVFTSYIKGNSGSGNTTEVPALFPMSGAAFDQTITAPTSENTSPVTNLSIEVNRLVSKVEKPTENSSVIVDIPTEQLVKLFGEGATGAKFTLKGYVLINGYDKSDAFFTWDSYSNWDNWSREGKAYLASTFDAGGHYTAVYAGTHSHDDMFLTDNTIYVYENQPENDPDEPALYYDKNTVNSFIIKGDLTCVSGGANNGMVATRYWRANLIPDDNHRLYRNTIYRLSIDGVNTSGYGTPEEAENEVVPKAGNASVSVTIHVAKWKVKTTNTIL